jgi:uncharacterized membrane protein YfcA
LSFLVAVSVIGVGAFVGIVSAMFGVGGGVIMVPYMVTFLDKTQHVAEGTSLMVIVPTAIAGVIAHNKRGYVSFSAGWLIAAFGVVGAILGARLALGLDPEALQKLFGVFTILVGTRIGVEGIRKRRDGDEERSEEVSPGPAG